MCIFLYFLITWFELVNNICVVLEDIVLVKKF